MSSPEKRIFTNFQRWEIIQSIRNLQDSIELDKVEVGFYQIIDRKLSETTITAPDEAEVPMGVDFALREKDEIRRVLLGLVQREYDSINGKEQVIRFLNRLLPYAT